MAKSSANKPNASTIAIVKKMKDYSEEPLFKKKAAKAIAFLDKHGIPPGKKPGK